MQLFAGLVLGGVTGIGYSTNWNFNLNQNTQKQIDYSKIRESISDILPNADHDDGTIGPFLAWHASGTYDKKSNTGGSNGSTMRFNAELNDGANAGLKKAQNFLEPIKKQYPEISYADLWILASYVAIEEMGGPRINFTPGRTDATSEQQCPPNGRLPDATKDASHIRDVFGRMGFTDREMVALIGGGHGIGRCHKDRSGFEGPWTFTPMQITNNFFKELFNQEWKVKQWDGPKQYEDAKTGKLMMLPADLELIKDKTFKQFSQIYKENQDQFLSDFADSFKRLTELGFVKSL